MSLPDCFTTNTRQAHALHCVRQPDLADWRRQQPPAVGAWLDVHTFRASTGNLLLFPHEAGIGGAVLGIGDLLDPFDYAHAPFALPPGDWTLSTQLPQDARRAMQLGWGLGSYRFDRYKAMSRQPARLATEDGVDSETRDLLAACVRTRDLTNTPTEDLGPEQLEAVVREIAHKHGAKFDSIVGDALLAQNFPAIHAVGRASHRAPRLLRLDWGDPTHPLVALVGKGVCFDTGGLDIKPADGMRNMKKDMGGAAHAIALAELVMARRLPLRIMLLVPAVENSIGPDSFRPGDVIKTRTGVTIEIDNTDAEGRVVLGDALAHAGESAPQLLLDFATLTGAARVALGPDLPALFANDESLANAWLEAGAQVRDPVWRMPLWRPYLRYLTSHVADLANASSSRMAGSISAALYLERFVPAGLPWAHLDVYGWNDSERPGRPAGGEAQGLRSAYAMLRARFSV